MSSQARIIRQKGSKNYGISLIGPNSHKNRIRVEIGGKNKQTEAERKKNNYSRLHTPTRALEGFQHAASTCDFLHSRRAATGGSVGSVRAFSGRVRSVDSDLG